MECEDKVECMQNSISNQPHTSIIWMFFSISERNFSFSSAARQNITSRSDPQDLKLQHNLVTQETTGLKYPLSTCGKLSGAHRMTRHPDGVSLNKKCIPIKRKGAEVPRLSGSKSTAEDPLLGSQRPQPHVTLQTRGLQGTLVQVPIELGPR